MAHVSYDTHLGQIMELIWAKIDERFQAIAPAFRFFDVN